MRIESFKYMDRFGSILLRDVQKILELDSGRKHQTETIGVKKIEEDEIKDIEEKMAIIIPIKNEKLKIFDGCISGIPHECLKIVVSGSDLEPFNRFLVEKETLKQFCEFTKRRAFIIHQKDSDLSRAFLDAGYKDILGEDGIVRDGKAEGMIVGIVLAKLLDKKYVGFIDADNYIPGSVLEYVKAYAAGFTMCVYKRAMVRILWRFKPKISEQGLYFKKWGRVSQTTNKFLNALLSNYTGFETEIIKTGNSGEHAMTMELAESIPYASGYAIEPQEFLTLFEKFGGVLPSSDINEGVGIEVLQIETRNPHLHEEKGKEHIHEMLHASLGAIYHSPICTEDIKEMIIEELVDQGILNEGEEPEKPNLMGPLMCMNFDKFKSNFDISKYAVYNL